VDDDDTKRRLGRLETNQLKMVELLGRIESHLKDMNGDLRDVKAEVGSIPDSGARGSREPLGFRLHRLENDNAAASAAEAALASADVSRDQAATSKQQAWSWKQKNVLFAFAALAAIDTLLRLFGIGG
jgi:hypothetical protein